MKEYVMPEMKISIFDKNVDTAGTSDMPVRTVSYDSMKEIKQYLFD